MWGAPRSKTPAAPRAARRARPALVLQIALIAIAIQLSACALITARPSAPAASVSESSADQTARATELIRTLAERDRALDSMQTPAVMEFSNPKHHLKAREVITLRRPQDLRIEAMSPLGVAMVVAAKDSQVAIFRSSDNTLMRGAATAATLNRFAQVPLAPKSAIGLLMGLAPDPNLLSKPPDSVRTADAILIASWRLPDGGTLELGFAGGELALVRQRLQDGRISCEVRYGDFQDIGGLMMAYQVEADFPPAQSKVKFRFQRPIVNGAIADSMFVLSPGPSTREIDLDRETLSSLDRETLGWRARWVGARA